MRTGIWLLDMILPRESTAKARELELPWSRAMTTEELKAA